MKLKQTLNISNMDQKELNWWKNWIYRYSWILLSLVLIVFIFIFSFLYETFFIPRILIIILVLQLFIKFDLFLRKKMKTKFILMKGNFVPMEIERIVYPNSFWGKLIITGKFMYSGVECHAILRTRKSCFFKLEEKQFILIRFYELRPSGCLVYNIPLETLPDNIPEKGWQKIPFNIDYKLNFEYADTRGFLL